MENLLNNGYMWIMPVYKVNEIFLTEYLWIQFCTTTNDIFLSAILWHEPVTVVITFCKINKSKTLYYIGFSCHFLILFIMMLFKWMISILFTIFHGGLLLKSIFSLVFQPFTFPSVFFSNLDWLFPRRRIT